MAKSFRDRFKTFVSFNQNENTSAQSREHSQDSEQQIAQTPTPIVTDQSQIAFENADMKLIVERAQHRRQKRFRLQDHLFYFKIEQKSDRPLPLLIDILDFLHAGNIYKT